MLHEIGVETDVQVPSGLGVVVVRNDVDEVEIPLTFSWHLGAETPESALRAAEARGVVKEGDRVCVFFRKVWEDAFRIQSESHDKWNQVLSGGQIMQVS